MATECCVEHAALGPKDGPWRGTRRGKPAEAVFEEAPGSGTPLRLSGLPPPSDEEVERLAATVARRVLGLLRKRGAVEEHEAPSDGAQDLLWLEAVQPRRRWPEAPRERRPGRRCAFVEGFSLHANTWIHENDVVGLERLCSYGARGPLSLERLSALPDGRLAYRMRRPSPSGQTHLVLPPVAFLRRLAALVPPPKSNLVRYFGVFAPNARVRARVVPTPSSQPTRPAPPPLPFQPLSGTRGAASYPDSLTRMRVVLPWIPGVGRKGIEDDVEPPFSKGKATPMRV
jgi:hypothetical protein